MTLGYPPAPTFRSIFAGIAAFVILLIAFLSIGSLIKFLGATLTFIPAKLGLIQVVTRQELIPVDMSAPQTSIAIKKAGRYALFTDNYDLLVINDAVVASDAKPWLKITPVDPNRTEIGVNLVKRGLAIYDTPVVKGRPVATFEITEPGEYTLTHPTRPTVAYILPDYTTGNENWIIFLMILQVIILAFIVRDIFGTIKERKKAPKA